MPWNKIVAWHPNDDVFAVSQSDFQNLRPETTRQIYHVILPRLKLENLPRGKLSRVETANITDFLSTFKTPIFDDVINKT